MKDKEKEQRCGKDKEREQRCGKDKEKDNKRRDKREKRIENVPAPRERASAVRTCQRIETVPAQ